MGANSSLAERDGRTSPQFDYEAAFARNLGWITDAEQRRLRESKVAVAGLGGVGGSHLLTLTRLGIGRFHISDLDRFELVNFNRQAGATLASVDRPKVDVLAEMARSINPEVELELFGDGIRDDNLDAFLDGVDLFVDGFDFFEVDIRAKAFARCSELDIPAITAGPIGMGTAYVVFLPGGMTFEDYFCFSGRSTEEKFVNFLAGLTPQGFHRRYLVEPERLDLANRRGPSTPMGCDLAAGVVGSESLKVLLGRGRVYAAPYYHQFDAFLGRWKRGRLWRGNRGPWQRIKLGLGYRAVAHMLRDG